MSGAASPGKVPRVLVLAGSSEASALAARLAARGDVEVVSSFAGRVRALSVPPGRIRVGGFGGPDGLARWLADEHVDAVIDATHPFTARMPRHAALACDAVGLPRLRVLRPAWARSPGDRWYEVGDLEGAASMLTTLGARRAFLTTGRQELAPFSQVRGAWFLVRAIEAPDPIPIAAAQVVLARGPFEAVAERELMSRHRIDALVTKNSGGDAAGAKLAAARELGVAVVMVRRPAPVGPTVGTVDDAMTWLVSVLAQSPCSLSPFQSVDPGSGEACRPRSGRAGR